MKSGVRKVLVGGCFDVLHPGHIIFLQKAKRQGDKLIVLLESDRKVKMIKGVGRPIYGQKARALMLKALKCVDKVILLPFMETDKQYDDLVKKFKPDVIATTSGDPNQHHKRAAGLVGAKFIYVTERVGNHSTSLLIKSQF